MLDTIVLDGTVTLIAVAVLCLELILIFGFSMWRGERPSASLVANGLSGLLLILALRAALVGQGSGAIALFLGLGGLAHLGDLLMRRDRTET